VKKFAATFHKPMYLMLALFVLTAMLPMLPAHASTTTPPIQLDLIQLASNGNGKVTFQIINPPSEFDFSSLTAAASWDNSNWSYAIWYQGGCPTACVVEWVGGGVPFYIKLTNQDSSIIFNETVDGGAFSTPYTQLDLQQLSSDGNGKVTFQILNPPPEFDFSSLTTAGASWDNSSWVYAIWYQGGCPNACVVEWTGQTTTPFYVKLANQVTSIIFNQAVSPISNTPTNTPTEISTNTPIPTNTPTEIPTNTPIPTLVPFSFTGFFRPIDNLPVLNVINAGRGVAIKFSLDGYRGLEILANGYPTSSTVECGTAAEDAVEQILTVGSSSLSYDVNADQYSYIWKTDKTWAGTCRTLIIKLSDGTYHRANFKFK
jgi:hypothetical protein